MSWLSAILWFLLGSFVVGYYVSLHLIRSLFREFNHTVDSLWE